MKKWVLLIAALLLLAACTDEETPLANEETEEETNVEETEEESVEEEVGTEETEEDSVEEETGTEETEEESTEELSWDEQILSEEGKSLLLSGKIPGTELSIGSTLAEVEAELGSPVSEDFLAGAPLKSYGNIHIAHLTDSEEVVAFHLTFDEPVTMDTVYETWGEPTEIGPMQIDDLIEVQNYQENGYIASYGLTSQSPDKATMVSVSKNN